MTETMSKFNAWLTSEMLSPNERAELEAISQSPDEIKSRFSCNLSFGTAGLRGIMRMGTNAMNVYTVAQATQGLAQYILSVTGTDRSVAIAYDSRINSKIFAQTAASVLAGNGIHSYIFDDIRPTPELSFALRHLKCIAGINITASHNPKEYNGYKAYWEDGAQLSPDQAEVIAKYISDVDIQYDIKKCDFDKAVADNKISVIGNDVDEAYLSAVIAQAIDLNNVKKAANELNIVYTPLHGAGYRLVPEVLRRIGIKNLHSVQEQSTPDGTFPTTKKPNPEYPEVFEIGIKLADRVGSDLIIATDPDADRVGVMARGNDGKFSCITGNQMAALLLDYIISAYHTSNNMPSEPFAVKSIVTTELMAKICRAGNVELHNVLTGFKYIGEVIKKKEAEGRGTFIFGAEESYGYLKGTYARDKDAVVASMIICEMTSYYKLKKMTLIDALNNLYDKYGFSFEKTTEIAITGYDAAEVMKNTMFTLRNHTPYDIAGIKIKKISDYLTETVVDIDTKITSSTGLPKSDVIRWELENSDVIIIRPSGTEPKIKIYYLLSSQNKETAPIMLQKYIDHVSKIMNV